MNSSSSNITITDYPKMSHGSSSPLVCYAPTMISMGGIWRGENPLDFSFPLFIFQLLIIILTTRATAIILHPFQQPRYLAEIIGGLVLGPSMMGQIPNFGHLIFPLRSVLILETMANIGLIYFVFIVGVEIDRSAVHRSTQSVAFAAACVGIPFTLCILTALVVPPKHGMMVSHWAFLIFLCITLSITAFSVLARRLAELKLLNTTLGTTALTTAMLVDSFAWALLVLAITLVQHEGKLSGTLYMVVSGLVFYLSMTSIVKPAVQWVIDQTPEGEEVDDFYACVILVTVLVSAFVSDAIGIHAISGAFMFGLVIPSGPLGEALIERIEDFVEGLLLPLFFATSGLKMDFEAMNDSGTAVFMALMVVVGTAAKIAGCVVVARLHDMPVRDGIAMGLLMNTKGVTEMVLLNIGRDRQLLSEEAFSMLVCLSVLLTFINTPILRYVVRPARRLASYTRRTVQWPKPDDELRLVLCVHSPRQVPTTLALLEATHPTKRSPITVFALNLIELTSRASAMMIVTSATTKETYASHPFGSSFNSSTNIGGVSSRSHSDHIMHAFETYEQHTAGVSVQPLTAVSPYTSMHCDIFGIAEETHAALVVLPFHKQQTVDGGMEATNPAIRTLNQNVLNSAPCSIGILVDRGLRTATRLLGGGNQQHVTVLFLGGPDDREAIAVASRMVDHPGINLMVVRFVPGEDSPKAQRVVNMACDEEDKKEKQSDDDCVGDFRLRYASYKSVTYMERVVGNAEEMVTAIRATLEEGASCDLCIVGRGREMGMTAGMTEWSECPELGAVGDLLASVDFGATASVLVLQQCRERMTKMKALEVEEALQENAIHSGFGK